jgi:uncharacterized membrane protein YdbT with pleckstrin-like domain
MGYVDSNLMTDETVRYRTRLHKILFFWPGIFAMAFCILLVWLLHQGTYKPLYVGFCYILAIIIMLPSYIQYISSEFVVTNKRVVVKVGFIRRHTMETQLQKIEAIEVEQSVLGRICNFGTISIIGTGGTKEPFKNINNPLGFRRAVEEQTDINVKSS